MFIIFFRPVNQVPMVRAKLETLQQRGHDIGKFNSLFNSLVVQLPAMEMEEKMYKYKTKLDPQLQLILVGRTFNNVTEMMKAALEATSALRLINPSTQQQQRSSYPQQRPTPTPVTNNNVQSHSENTHQPSSSNDEGETSMNVHNTNTSTMKIPKMNPSIKEHCMKNKLCFRCRQGGHSSRECTVFTNRTSNTSNFTPSTNVTKPHF